MLAPTPLSQTAADRGPPEAAYVRTLSSTDPLWDRPVFRAPPLEVQPPLEDVADWLVSQRTPPFERAD